MKVTFVETSDYQKSLDSLPDRGAVKNKIEKELLADPTIGNIVPGTGGLRKFRISTSTKGKRGGYRVVYYDFSKNGEIYLISIYPKSVQDDLSEDAKKQIKKLIELIKKQSGRGSKNGKKK